MNQKYLLLGGLLLAIVVNTVVHITYAPYKEYKEGLKSLHALVVANGNQIRAEVNDMMLPKITNLVKQITRESDLRYMIYTNRATSVSTQSVVEFVENDSAEKPERINPLWARVQVVGVGGEWVLWDRPYTYKVGDDLYCGRITAIHPTFVDAGGRRYWIEGNKSANNYAIVETKK